MSSIENSLFCYRENPPIELYRDPPTFVIEVVQWIVLTGLVSLNGSFFPNMEVLSGVMQVSAEWN